MADSEPSYIDYEAFLDPSFSPASFANELVLTTNNPSDAQLDLATPLSRVLFDVQEIDTHIHTLTTKSAEPLLTYTKDSSEASQRIVDEVEEQVAHLTSGYRRLEKEVVQRWEVAEEIRTVTERLLETVRTGRSVGRSLLLGRQLEAQMADMDSREHGGERKEGHRAMVRASNTLLALRQLFAASGPGEEGEGLQRVKIIAALESDIINPAERNILSRAQQIVREFSMSSLATATKSAQASTPAASTYAQTEDAKSRATSALLSLYLLSPITKGVAPADFQPALVVSALQTYLQTALTSSLAALTRALSTLPTLDRTLIEVSARCQNIVALEGLLESIRPPPHPMLSSPAPSGSAAIAPANLLQPLLISLDTTSLPSYFWRSLASSLSPRVQEILNRGGVSARTLRSNKERVRDAIRNCVLRGSRSPNGSLIRAKVIPGGNWEREAAVMVGAVLGFLGR